jgi:hypothetical protein
MTDQRMITVSLDDLALALYLPEPTTTPGHPSVARCVACGQPCGAHYCAPREAASHRLRRSVTEALNA